MANAHILTTNMKHGFPIMDISFASQTIANSNTSTVLSGSHKFAQITALGGPIYIAASSNGSANASIDPRLYIAASQSVILTYGANTTIHVIDA